MYITLKCIYLKPIKVIEVKVRNSKIPGRKLDFKKTLKATTVLGTYYQHIRPTYCTRKNTLHPTLVKFTKNNERGCYPTKRPLGSKPNLGSTILF